MSPTPDSSGKGSASRAGPRGPTRERILAYLEENRTASVQTLSRAWGLTRADIRYHFTALLSEGIIELVPRDLSLSAPRGRPEQIYRLAANSLPDNFPILCAALLDALLCPLPIEDREPALRALATRLAGRFVSVPSLTPRLNQSITFLSQHGYRARWEAHAWGPRILLRTCPYAEILPAHPELCLLDRFLLEHLVHFPLQQTARMDMAGNKPSACVFSSRLES